jgi:hypothetical protein
MSYKIVKSNSEQNERYDIVCVHSMVGENDDGEDVGVDGHGRDGDFLVLVCVDASLIQRFLASELAMVL